MAGSLFALGESHATQALLILILPRGIHKKRNGSFLCKKQKNCLLLPFIEKEAFAIKILWITDVLHKHEKPLYYFFTVDFFLISTMMGKNCKQMERPLPVVRL